MNECNYIKMKNHFVRPRHTYIGGPLIVNKDELHSYLNDIYSVVIHPCQPHHTVNLCRGHFLCAILNGETRSCKHDLQDHRVQSNCSIYFFAPLYFIDFQVEFHPFYDILFSSHTIVSISLTLFPSIRGSQCSSATYSSSSSQNPTLSTHCTSIMVYSSLSTFDPLSDEDLGAINNHFQQLCTFNQNYKDMQRVQALAQAMATSYDPILPHLVHGSPIALALVKPYPACSIVISSSSSVASPSSFTFLFKNFVRDELDLALDWFVTSILRHHSIAPLIDHGQSLHSDVLYEDYA